MIRKFYLQVVIPFKNFHHIGDKKGNITERSYNLKGVFKEILFGILKDVRL